MDPFRQASLIGMVTGMVAGLATITPASGYVGPVGALAIGLAAGLACQWFTGLVKQTMRIDDSLDVFAVHGVGGALGTLLTAFFATVALGGIGLADGVGALQQFGVQLLGVVVVAIWSGIGTFIIVKAVQALVGLRVDAEDEIEGLDIVAHGERGYDL